MTSLRALLLTFALIVLGSTAVQAAPKGDGSGAIRLILAGPGVVLILLVSFALVALVAAFLRNAGTLAAFGRRALRRLEERRLITPLRGVAASVLCVVASLALFSTKILALSGVLVLLTGLGLTGLGLCVAAVHLGRIWAEALGRQEVSNLATLGMGLMILLLAAGVPLVGWAAVIVAVGGGVGAALECLFERREP